MVANITCHECLGNRTILNSGYIRVKCSICNGKGHLVSENPSESNNNKSSLDFTPKRRGRPRKNKKPGE